MDECLGLKKNLSPFHLCNLIFEFTKQLNALTTLMDDCDLLSRHIIFNLKQ
jgi:hypothetical protein